MRSSEGRDLPNAHTCSEASHSPNSPGGRGVSPLWNDEETEFAQLVSDKAGLAKGLPDPHQWYP